KPNGDRLKQLVGLRDVFLFLGGASYVLGYIVWCLHAWQENLGLLPALQFQYIFAGLAPLVLGGLIVMLVTFVRDITQGMSDQDLVAFRLVSVGAIIVTMVALSLLIFHLWGMRGLLVYV